MIYYHCIDFADKKSAISCRRALLRLVSTIDCSEPMQYYFGGFQKEHALYVHSEKNEEQMDEWLYSVKASGDYIGTFVKLVSENY